MTTLSAYCQSMGWDLNDPAIRAKVQSAVGNIGDNTELNEAQMDKLQEALYNALGTVQPGEVSMLDAFNGKDMGNETLQFKSNQDAIDYLNATSQGSTSGSGYYTQVRNDLSKRWQKANGFVESSAVVLDMIANANAYMPWNL